MDYDLGYFDDETCRLEPLQNPFGPKVLPMSPVQTVTYVSGTDPRGDGAQRRIRTTDTRIFSPLLYQLSYLGLFRQTKLVNRIS